jgi:hypothetical protein
MKKLMCLLVLVAAVSYGAPNTGAPLYDTDRNPVMLGVDLSDSLPQIRWLVVDSTGALAVTIPPITIPPITIPPSTPERLYPYFTSGIVDSTLVDSLYLFPMPVVSFWLRNASASDTLYASWEGPGFPASYISILPLSSLGLENISRPEALNGLFLDSSADSLPWELIVLSDSLSVPM